MLSGWKWSDQVYYLRGGEKKNKKYIRKHLTSSIAYNYRTAIMILDKRFLGMNMVLALVFVT